MTHAQLDVLAFRAALDARRKSSNLSWRQAAAEAEVSASTLTRIGQGKRPDVDSFAALIHWLGVPPDSFLRSRAEIRPEPDLLTVISTHLRARRELTPDSAQALEDIIRAAYDQLKTHNADA